METTLHRVQRLFPDKRMRIQQVGDTIEVKDSPHICWIPVAEIDPLDDADVQMLVYSLLHGLVK